MKRTGWRSMCSAHCLLLSRATASVAPKAPWFRKVKSSLSRKCRRPSAPKAPLAPQDLPTTARPAFGTGKGLKGGLYFARGAVNNSCTLEQWKEPKTREGAWAARQPALARSGPVNMVTLEGAKGRA